MSNKMPDCENCPPNGYPLCDPGNIEVVELVDTYINFMCKAGSIPDITSIANIFTLEGYENRRDLFDKILFYTQIAAIERNRDMEPHRVVKSK